MTSDWDWAQTERRIREQAYATINNDPQILLEHDSYFDVDADLIYARLIGMEDEIVADGLLLRKAEPVILLPITPKWSLAAADPTEIAPGVHRLGDVDILLSMEPLRTARYVLQSGYVAMSISGKYEPPVEKLRDDNTAMVAYLRYRRRA